MGEKKSGEFSMSRESSLSIRSGAKVDNLIRDYFTDNAVVEEPPNFYEMGQQSEEGFVAMIKDPRFYHYTTSILQTANGMFETGRMDEKTKNEVHDAYELIMISKLDTILQSLLQNPPGPGDAELFGQLSITKQILISARNLRAKNENNS